MWGIALALIFLLRLWNALQFLYLFYVIFVVFALLDFKIVTVIQILKGIYVLEKLLVFFRGREIHVLNCRPIFVVQFICIFKICIFRGLVVQLVLDV